MVPIGMGLAWGSYTLMFWGYVNLKGYQLGILDIIVPGRYKGSWPPPLVGAPAPDNSANTGGNGSGGAQGTPGPGNVINPGKPSNGSGGKPGTPGAGNPFLPGG